MGTISIQHDKSVYTSTTGDYFTDVALGLIPGLNTIPIVTGTNVAVGQSFVDVTDQGGIRGEITSAESLEILSDDVNDTSAGTGLRTVLLVALDENDERQNVVISMNGTTAVAVSGTYLNPERIVSITSGSSGNNAGTITLRVASAGATRLQMKPDQGVSFSSIYKVPADTTSLIYQTFSNVPKGEDVELRSRVRISTADPTELTGGTVDLYQNNLVFPLKSIGVFTEKTTFWLQAKSTNIDVNVTAAFEVMEIDSTNFNGEITAVARNLII